MANNRAVQVEELPGGSPGPWPRNVSAKPEFSIGAVVSMVSAEFPATTVSKIRFLEEKGLLKPHRAQSGYRKYSRSDVERIRFILTQQRDSYAPLKVIGEQLLALDAGHDVEPVATARLVASEGKTLIPKLSEMISGRELSDLSGVTPERLQEYVQLGLVTPDLAGYFPARTVNVISLLLILEDAGIPARNLRPVRQGAERSADIVDQAVSSRQNRTKPGEKERGRAQYADLAQLFGRLHQEFLAIAAENLSST